MTEAEVVWFHLDALTAERHDGQASDEGREPYERREVAFDVMAVVGDLRTRGYPNASFMESVLTGARPMAEG